MKHFYQRFVVLFVVSMMSVCAFAYDAEIDGICYFFDEEAKTASVACRDYSHYNSYSGSVTIPSSVVYNGQTYSVTSIGFSAFRDCPDLTDVTIPNSVTSLADQAFLRCSSLNSVSFGNSVSTIGYMAFTDCTSLTEFTLPNSVTTIGGYAFRECTNLAKISLGNSLTTIGGDAFYGCICLTHIELPSSMTKIEASAFENCTGLTSISLGEGLMEIGYRAFASCTALESITLPNSLTHIDESFGGCSALTKVVSCIMNPFRLPPHAFDIYETATLYVPYGTSETYKNTYAWNKFIHIEEMSSLNVENKKVSSPKEMQFFSLDGRRQKAEKSGINIIRMSDGTMKKTIKK